MQTADAKWMRRALELAERGGRGVSPNPKVGCVLVRGGKVVGEGFHKRFGGPHAEPQALRAAGPKAKGATAYVTLEPCAAFPGKKTPSCAAALTAAGVLRVVAAVKDPNPSVSGRGLNALRRVGLKVESGVLETEARALNLPFFTRMNHERPYVILKAAVTLDGKMTTRPGTSKWITSPEARKAGHLLRAAADAILVGVGTVLSDDPALTSHGKGPDPLRVVLDSRDRTPAKAKVRDSSAPTVIYTRKTVSHSAGHLNLRAVLKDLAGRGVGTLLVEGGPEVHASFLKAGFADEVRVFLAPGLSGFAGAKSLFNGTGVAAMVEALNLSEMTVSRVGPDLMVSAKVNR